jgi:hypothetical protein
MVARLFAAKSRAYTCRWPEMIWRTAGCSRRSLRRRVLPGARDHLVWVVAKVVRGEEPRLHLPVAGIGLANHRL